MFNVYSNTIWINTAHMTSEIDCIKHIAGMELIFIDGICFITEQNAINYLINTCGFSDLDALYYIILLDLK